MTGGTSPFARRNVPLSWAVGALLALVNVADAQAAAGGRFIYRDKVYPSAEAACSALLKDLSPPQTLKKAGPPDKDGDVHCVGKTSDGEDGFDQYQNGVKFERPTAGEPTKPSGSVPAAAGAEPPDTDCPLDQLSAGKLTAAITSRVQRFVDEANQQLIDNPKQATLESKHSGVGFFDAVYGSIVERLTAQRVKSDKCLSKYLTPLTSTEQSKPGKDGYKGTHPDFRGRGKAKGLEIDVTTRKEAATKPLRDGGKAAYIFVTYERGLKLDPKSGVAVKI